MRGERCAFHPEDDGNIGYHQQQLSSEHAEVPGVRLHLTEVDLAERHQQGQEYQEGKQGAEHGQQRIACSIELRQEVETGVAHRTQTDGYGERPVLTEFNETVHRYCVVFVLVELFVGIAVQFGLYYLLGEAVAARYGDVQFPVGKVDDRRGKLICCRRTDNVHTD